MIKEEKDCNIFTSKHLYIYKSKADNCEKNNFTTYCCNDKQFVIESIYNGDFYFIRVNFPMLKNIINTGQLVKKKIKAAFTKR